jgi:hypothetical protein
MRKHSGNSNASGLNSNIIQPNSQRKSGTLPDTTAPLSTYPSKWRKTKTERTFALSIESHITIFPKVELSKKRISLLLEEEILRVCSEGFSLLDYFGFEWMMNYLVGSSKLHEVNGKKMSSVVYCANLILLAYRGNENLLYQTVQVHQLLIDFVRENFGSYFDRKYQARRQIYNLEKFLLVKIEDVNSVFERSSNSVRYSSYCKGYGESGRSVRKQRTRYSFELDRDDHEVEPEEFYSFGNTIHEQEDLFEIEQLIRQLKEK